MSAHTPTSTRPYVSRRKRRSVAQDPSSASNKLTFGLLGLLVLGLFVSLGIIATHLVNPVAPASDVADNTALMVTTPAKP
ncbi:hypothetical protein [Hymenobacter sp. GOD-10R]|uniref:hypothetical protein n=1 Tax=Hymenobacter sp. GOD-10R TaxID=3093922 RepID=UPI002D7897D9|nr:hypothetical protein [Hymenobacter sp. GOD-10R]WRQ28552.1 hypothetical protein SD425_26140 [Hymenobacter sp. GOD-10R]